MTSGGVSQKWISGYEVTLNARGKYNNVGNHIQRFESTYPLPAMTENHHKEPANVSRLDPLAIPGVIRILLSERSSLALTESGETVFALIGRQSWPGDPKRWVIYLKPSTLQPANAATRVLNGTHTARPIRKPATGQPRND